MRSLSATFDWPDLHSPLIGQLAGQRSREPVVLGRRRIPKRVKIETVFPVSDNFNAFATRNKETPAKLGNCGTSEFESYISSLLYPDFIAHRDSELRQNYRRNRDTIFKKFSKVTPVRGGAGLHEPAVTKGYSVICTPSSQQKQTPF